MSKLNDFIKGIEILKKYDPKLGEDYMSAAHDQIWFADNAEEIKGKLSPEDFKFLLGTPDNDGYLRGGVFMIDEEVDSFSMFV